MLDIKIWQIAQELVKCGGHQYSGVQVQDKHRNLLKKNKDTSNAKNNKKETKPWKFYDSFHEAVKDKPEISLRFRWRWSGEFFFKEEEGNESRILLRRCYDTRGEKTRERRKSVIKNRKPRKKNFFVMYYIIKERDSVVVRKLARQYQGAGFESRWGFLLTLIYIYNLKRKRPKAGH